MEDASRARQAMPSRPRGVREREVVDTKRRTRGIGSAFFSGRLIGMTGVLGPIYPYPGTSQPRLRGAYRSNFKP